MSQEQTKQIAQEFLSRLGAGAEPEEIAKLFTPDLDFDIPGDAGALPWKGLSHITVEVHTQQQVA